MSEPNRTFPAQWQLDVNLGNVELDQVEDKIREFVNEYNHSLIQKAAQDHRERCALAAKAQRYIEHKANKEDQEEVIRHAEIWLDMVSLIGKTLTQDEAIAYLAVEPQPVPSKDVEFETRIYRHTKKQRTFEFWRSTKFEEALKVELQLNLSIQVSLYYQESNSIAAYVLHKVGQSAISGFSLQLPPTVFQDLEKITNRMMGITIEPPLNFSDKESPLNEQAIPQSLLGSGISSSTYQMSESMAHPETPKCPDWEEGSDAVFDWFYKYGSPNRMSVKELADQVGRDYGYIRNEKSKYDAANNRLDDIPK